MKWTTDDHDEADGRHVRVRSTLNYRIVFSVCAPKYALSSSNGWRHGHKQDRARPRYSGLDVILRDFALKCCPLVQGADERERAPAVLLIRGGEGPLTENAKED